MEVILPAKMAVPVVLVAVDVGIVQVELQDHQLHLLTEFHQLPKVMQVVLLLAIMVVVAVVVPVLLEVIRLDRLVLMVALDCQILLELVQLYSMQVVAVVEDTQVILTV